MWSALFPEKKAEDLENDFFMLDNSVESSMDMPGTPIQRHSDVILLCGEVIVQRETDVELLGQTRQVGVLFLTNYRLLFVPEKRSFRVQSIPLGCIAQIDNNYNVMRILCKYFRLVEFCWTLCPDAVGANQDMSVSAYMWSAASVTSSTILNSPLQIFRQAVIDQAATPFGLVSAFLQPISPNAHVVYSGIEQEMARLSVPAEQWRVCGANEDYSLCATYPRSICVPASITDQQLRSVASFRSNGRLPAMCWYNVVTGASIVRCAQPLVGLLRACCQEDVALVDAVRLSNSGLNEQRRQNDARSNSLIYLVDARPKISAYANQAKGAGTENPANYPNSRQVFLGIENIHAVRVSHKALFDLLLGQCLSGESSSGWYAGIEKTGWMEHIQSVVKGAGKVVEMMSTKASVVIHCSDGWDRTSQISGLAQILMDPYYRTLKGFAVLIEKEWLSFGHKFEDRHTQKKLGFWTEHESSPIFGQWLDCVYQVMVQFPRAFEFNEKFLLTILDNSYSLRYITFLGLCEKDRIKFRGMAGLWNVLLDDTSMVNTDYAPCNSTLKVEWHTPAMMTIWKSLYLRFFVRHGSGPGSAFSHHEPDYERSDRKSNNENDGPVSWSEAKNSRDDQICLSEEVDLTIFDDYETSAKMIPLRPKQETEETSFTTTVYNQCQKIANNLFSQPVLTN